MSSHVAPWVGSVDELVAQVAPGSRLSVGGVHYTRTPVAALRALAARGTGDLTYVAWGGGVALDYLLAHDLVSTAEICFSNADVYGLAPRYRKAAESGALELRERTALQLLTGLRAEAEHLQWAPLQAPTGTVFEDPALALDTVPPGQRVDAVPIDVLLLHAQRADNLGNVEIEGARTTDVQAIFAAKRVLVTVEERVPRGALSARSSFLVPRDRVTCVALAPKGAFPTSCLPYYAADIAAFGQAMFAPDAAAMTAALTPGEGRPAPLPRVTVSEISEAIRGRQEAVATGEWTIDELMVCWLARTVDNASICTCGSSAPLAVAAYMLAKRTHAPGALIMSMNGCYVDVDERPLSLGLAEYQDYLSAPVHCGGEDTYRWYYQPGRITHEAVGAAQIDAYGATNNLWIDKPSGGRLRLPGQGGMADVANLHSDFLVYLPRHSSLVTTEKVAMVSSRRSWLDRDLRASYGYRTGRTAVLTDLCVMEPTGPGGRLRVTALHPGVELADVQGATAFEVELVPDWVRTTPPTEAELTALRVEVDPLGVRRLEFLAARERGPLLDELLGIEAELLRELPHTRPNRTPLVEGNPAP